MSGVWADGILQAVGEGKLTQDTVIKSPGITPVRFVHSHTSSFTVSFMRMQPADMELTSTSVIGYRAGVVDRVAIGVFRSAMVAVHERFAKGMRRNGHTDARDAV